VICLYLRFCTILQANFRIELTYLLIKEIKILFLYPYIKFPLLSYYVESE